MQYASNEQAIKDQRDERRLFRRRARTALVIIVVCMLALLGRYVWLQVISHESYATRSESNRVSIRPVAPNRGLIYDRRGRLVAENRPAYRLEIVPEKVKDIKALLHEISALVELSEDDISNFEKSRRHYRVFDSVPVKFNLSEQEVARFAVNRHRFAGVDVVPYLSRYYPYGELLTPVIGLGGRLDAAYIASIYAGIYRGTSMIGKIGV